MSAALITAPGDYLSRRVSFSLLLTLGELDEAVAPLFPNPRQQLAASSVFSVILDDTASRRFMAAVEPQAI